MFPVLGPADGCNGDHPVHESSGDDGGDFTDLTRSDFFLDRQKPAPEPIGVTDHSIHTARPDCVQHL